VLKLQSYKLRVQIMDDVQQLADLYLDMESSDAQLAYRLEVESIFSRITPKLWLNIDQMRKEIDTVRAKRLKTGANERAKLENEIAKLTQHLDAYYEKSFSHLEKMKQINMDIKEAQEKFIALLYERIDELSGRLELVLVRYNEFGAQQKETPDDTDITKSLNGARKSLDTNKKSMNTILRIMEALELDTTEYRTQLLTEIRDFSSGAFNTDVVLGLLSRSYNNTLDWAVKNGPGYIA
jgi:septal ring factor EnvC (AmiA/AmiB activator)